MFNERERHALVVDLSERGLRLERPLSGPMPRLVQLEFEIPGYDDLIWASGAICFDQLWRRDGAVGNAQFVRTSGIRIINAAARHLRTLREYVVESRRALEVEGVRIDRRGQGQDHGVRLETGGWLMRATHLR
jgi:hypothetical protein